MVATVHLEAFADTALTRLGRETVRRYYEWQLVGPHDATNLGAFRGGELAGFCFGGIFRGAMGGFLRAHRNYLAWRVATHPWLALSPLFRDRMAESLRILRRTAKPKSPATKPRVQPFGILAIAVSPRFQGLRVGQQLMGAAEAVARARGFAEMHLSVNADNARAIGFYEALGWRKLQRNGRWLGEMTKPLV